MSASATAKLNKKELIGWIVTIICTAAILLGFKNSTVLNWQQTQFFAITAFYILITAFELLPNMVVAILLPFTYLYFKLAPANNIFSSWNNNTIWLITCGILAANILARIGLLNRLVYWCVKVVGGSYKRLIFSFAIAGMILNLISASGGYIVFAAVAYSFCKTLHLEGTNTGKGLMLAATLMLGSGSFIYVPASHGLTASLAATIDPSFTLDYVIFFKHNAPNLIFYFISYIPILFLFKQDVEIDENIVREEANKMGPMSAAEKKGLIITLIFIAFVLTTSIHKIGMVYGFVLFATLFFFPGIKIGTAADIKSVNYSLVFFVAAFISIGTVASNLEFNAVVSQLLVPFLSGGNNVIIYASVFVFGFLINFLMTPLAAIAAFTTPLTQIAVDLGLGLYPTLYAFSGGIAEVLLPYEVAKYLVFYAYGMFNFADFAKLFGLRAIMRLIFFMAIMVPYWNLIGLT